MRRSKQAAFRENKKKIRIKARQTRTEKKKLNVLNEKIEKKNARTPMIYVIFFLFNGGP